MAQQLLDKSGKTTAVGTILCKSFNIVVVDDWSWHDAIS